ncbi:MAG: phosphatase PAP2 family protein [bacterium]|nr:phosphatase PAP2 family protein [bacterium]
MIIYKLDLVFFQALNQFAAAGTFFGVVTVLVARWLPYIVVVLALAILLAWAKTSGWKRACEITLTIFGVGLFTRFIIAELIRWYWPRLRPFALLDWVVQLVPREASASFPSGHAVFFFTLAAMFWLFNRRIGYGFGLLALVIGIARVMAGTHWPSDIVAGALIGIFAATVAGIVLRQQISTHA